MKKVCLKTADWIFVLILVFPGSVLFAEDPSSAQDQVISAGQPIATTPVPPALRQALASSLDEAVGVGAKAIPAPPAGTWGIISEGTGGGGIFRDSDSEAEAWLGSNRYGVQGFGSVSGGYFKDSDGTGEAKVGWGDYGINAEGDIAGGFFSGEDNQGNAYIGHGSMGISAYGAANGIEAYGLEMGGYFGDLDGTGYARVGYGDRGIQAYGTEVGGYFKDFDASGYAYVGYGDRGIEAWGSEVGGYFRDTGATAYAYVGYGNRGVEAWGADRGVHASGTNTGIYASGLQQGIEARGSSMAGKFEDSDDSGLAYVAIGDKGIYASGSSMGAEFSYSGDPFVVTWAHLAEGDYGINIYAEGVGGIFNPASTGALAYVAHSTYKISGTGTMAFVQNHPYEPSSVIVYAAPEGDEVATYTRGTARLVDGETRVPLGETFKWVTNPDIGLTAFLTPVGDWCDLFVAEQATDSIIVRSRDGSDCGFNYMVYGLRIGFEESSIVQEKKQESYIPSMADHRQLYDRRPDLRTYNSLERFKGMHSAVSPKAKLDLSRAQVLRDAIIEFDPAVHELPMPPGHKEMQVDDLASEEAQRGEVQRVRAARAGHDRRPATDQSDLSAAIPVDGEGNVYAPSFRPSSQDLASLVAVSETVEAGDVLVIDRGSAGMMRKGAEGHDSGVIGVVAAHAGVVLGSQPPPSRISETIEGDSEGEPQQQAAVALAGVVICKVDAGYGAVWPGDLLVTSPTPGHAMRTDSPLPGTMVGKALEQLEEGTGLIRVLVMLR